MSISETKKIVALCIYLLLSVSISLSRWYINQYNMHVDSYYSLYPYTTCVIPYITYKLNYKSKWFFFIFVQFFAVVYVYIFQNSSTIIFFNSLIDYSNMILRYHLFWKYIVYNTYQRNETVKFHIYASGSYLVYYADYQVERTMKYINIVPDYVFFTCCGLYVIIGAIVLKMYNVNEKHILMYDYVNVKRAFLKTLSIFFSSCILNGSLKYFEQNQIESHIATIIGSSFILTLNGQLLKYADYSFVKYVPGIFSIIVLFCMEYLNIYKSIVYHIGCALIVGIRLIIFDSLHQTLHITHKKNVIDRYIGLEVIGMSAAYAIVYYCPKNILFYLCNIWCICQLICVHFLKKYYYKDSEFLNCIEQLDGF